MPTLGITGGIATGKSTFTSYLRSLLPPTSEFFDADRAAHDLLTHDSPIQTAVRTAFGDHVMGSDGAPDRARLRELVFADAAARSTLEGILHPAIRRRWISLAQTSRPADEWLIVDIPLLYETEAEPYFDRVVVVACSPGTQRRRLRENRGLDDLMLEKIIGAQRDLGEKMKSANHVIWNDSTVGCLEGQCRLLAGWLCTYYG